MAKSWSNLSRVDNLDIYLGIHLNLFIKIKKKLNIKCGTNSKEIKIYQILNGYRYCTPNYPVLYSYKMDKSYVTKKNMDKSYGTYFYIIYIFYYTFSWIWQISSIGYVRCI